LGNIVTDESGAISLKCARCHSRAMQHHKRPDLNDRWTFGADDAWIWSRVGPRITLPPPQELLMRLATPSTATIATEDAVEMDLPLTTTHVLLDVTVADGSELAPVEVRQELKEPLDIASIVHDGLARDMAVAAAAHKVAGHRMPPYPSQVRGALASLKQRSH
jgi:hypothetical protein